jgi:CRISPR-associated protein Cmr1
MVKFQTHSVIARVSFWVGSPVHGGGVGWEDSDEKRHLRRIDSVTPIRGTAIRGQLRFWWRATSGCLAPSIAEMRDREATLWGAGSIPGLVSLDVESADIQAKSEDVYDSVPPKEAGKGWQSRARDPDLGYGAFAVQPKAGLPTKPQPGFVTRLSGNATLTLSWNPAFRKLPELLARELEERREEVTLALHSWLLFGGIGGRTRRGFGAVFAQNGVDLPDPESFLARLKNGTANLLPLVPSLIDARLVHGRACEGPDQAHRAALRQLRLFRQGVNVGRDADRENHPKRSRWPEPDELRRLTGSHAKHAPIQTVHKFPRAVFGLPIIFHFKKGDGDPLDPTLQPERFERMASPLILRPLSIGGQYCPGAIRLQVRDSGSQPLIVTTGKTSKSVQSGLDPSEASLVRPLGGDPDPLRAFLDFFRR